MPDLSVIIPGRCEMFMSRTVQDVLEKMRGDTEIICVADGAWPDPPIYDHPRVKVIHHTEAVGQRAATNDGVKLSRAKYVMKLDAHCGLDEGFDVKLMADCQPDWTLIPAMHHLHVFDWECKGCGNRTYQGAKPAECAKCHGKDFEMAMVWKPRHRKAHVSYRFDENVQFAYWGDHCKRPEWKDAPLVETMSCIGCCMFMERERYWQLGGMDEEHGSWGQYGTELACKAWLSGGKMVATRKTWISHLFRTGNFAGFNQGTMSTWPYPISQSQIEHARKHSRDIWMNNKWPLAVHPLSWLIERFAPVPGWSDQQLAAQKNREAKRA